MFAFWTLFLHRVAFSCHQWIYCHVLGFCSWQDFDLLKTLLSLYESDLTYMTCEVWCLQAAILHQAAEYISLLIAERQQLIELNQRYVAATRFLPVKQRKGSDGELSDDGSTMYTRQPISSDTRYKRRSPQNCASPHSCSLPIKKRKDEVSDISWVYE